jgi:hypothetical protein
MELSPRERWYWKSNAKPWLKALAPCKSYINFLMTKYFSQIIIPYVGVQYRILTRTYNFFIHLIYLLSLQIVHQSYSCALERCFLLHGRMYISQWHLCFHSNVFSKQLNVSKYFENGSWNLIYIAASYIIRGCIQWLNMKCALGFSPALFKSKLILWQL